MSALKLQSETLKSRTFWLAIVYVVGNVLQSFGIIPPGTWTILEPVIIAAGGATLRDSIAKK